MLSRRTTKEAGFSLLELIIVTVVMMIAALTGFPALMNMIHRSRVETSGQEILNIMQVAKLEAIKVGRETVVVIDPDARTVQAYVNVDEDIDRNFNPNPGAIFRTADYELRRATLQRGLEFAGPGGSTEAIDGFIHPEGGTEMLIFQPNGSIHHEGAYRIADQRQNFLEARVSPRATARVQFKKWDPDETTWIGRRHGDKAWKWY